MAVQRSALKSDYDMTGASYGNDGRQGLITIRKWTMVRIYKHTTQKTHPWKWDVKQNERQNNNKQKKKTMHR